MTEHSAQWHIPLLWRVGRNAAIALAAVAAAIGGGMILYRAFEDVSWVDAFVNVAMIVSGMGPLDNPVTDEGRIFAGFFSLFAGFMLVGVWGLILGPFVQDIVARHRGSGRQG